MYDYLSAGVRPAGCQRRRRRATEIRNEADGRDAKRRGARGLRDDRHDGGVAQRSPDSLAHRPPVARSEAEIVSGPQMIKRSALLGLALLRTTAHRPSAPLKLNLCLTYWCQYRCKTCNIWQRKPTDELTTDEVVALVRENPHVNWVDLTGGEIFLRRDIDDILDAIVTGWSRLAILHFPTNGFQTDRIVRSAERIAGRGPARIVVTVSVDGDEALNDEIRGIKGGFRHQMETFRALCRVPGIETALGMTLSTHNLGQFERTFAACARECPGLRVNDVHLNVAQKSA